MAHKDVPRTILAIHPGALGDVLLAVPAIRRVRAAFPEHACGMMVGEQVGRLLSACREVDRLFPLERGSLAGLLAGAEAMDCHLRSWLDRAELVIGWMKDPGGSLAETLVALGANRAVIRSPFDADCTSLHQTDRYLEIVGLGLCGERTARPLQLPGAILREASASLMEAGIRRGQLLVGIHPGSGSPHKCCKPGVFVELVEQLRAMGAVPVVLAGPADTEQLRAILQSSPHPLTVFDRLSLNAMAGLLAHMGLYVGHDSGLTHMAACLGVETIALFGPTDPSRWAPRGSHVEVLSGAPCTCDNWQQVQACSDKPCLPRQVEQVVERCVKKMQDRKKRLPGIRRHGTLPCHV